MGEESLPIWLPDFNGICGIASYMTSWFSEKCCVIFSHLNLGFQYHRICFMSDHSIEVYLLQKDELVVIEIAVTVICSVKEILFWFPCNIVLVVSLITDYGMDLESISLISAYSFFPVCNRCQITKRETLTRCVLTGDWFTWILVI